MRREKFRVFSLCANEPSARQFFFVRRFHLYFIHFTNISDDSAAYKYISRIQKFTLIKK